MGVRCGVEITPEINPIYVGLKRSCPGGSKNVLNVVVGLVDLFRLDFELRMGWPQ